MPKLRLFVTIAAGICASVSLAAFGFRSYSDANASPALPDIAIIQAAYDKEATPGNTKHDKDLKIVDARCYEKERGSFGCFVSFINRRDSDKRLYFDVAEVTRGNGIWNLKSGICKH